MFVCKTLASTVGIFVFFRSVFSYQVVPACDRPIYCHGKLLETVQNAGLFQDSKTFVDMKLRYSPSECLLLGFLSLCCCWVVRKPVMDTDTVLENFASLIRNGSLGNKTEVRAFVQTSFEGPGTEFETWEPTDFVDNPQFLSGVADGKLRNFGKSLCGLWKVLGRKIKQDVRDNGDRYSLLYVTHPFIVPGGRFREAYYWDSYWIIQGLILCEMNTTVKGMLQNFLDVVDRFGFVPNGLRVYYTRRSQPPLLTGMVDLYYRATGDVMFLKQALPLLEKEYIFWMTNRTTAVNTSGKQYVLNKYGTNINSARPESFREDTATAAHLPTDEEKSTLYSNLASAAESGWDFSTRWFKDDALSKPELQSTVIKDIVPVDLNGIMCMNERLLAKFYNITGNYEKSAEFRQTFEERKEAINSVLWNEIQGVWQDYYDPTASHRNYFFPSNVFPLFAECVGSADHNKTWYETRVLDYLKSHIALDFAGGIPTSLVNSGQQWDYPNVWPPLQHIMVTTLATSDLAESREIARHLAQKYVFSNWKGWKETNHMFEKYDVNRVGGRGGGGEYGVQTGFGWSNGVLLDFLHRYGDSLTTSDQTDDTKACRSTRCQDTSSVFIYNVLIISYLFS
ncbi:trehalase-like [Gigantopelta aegis]|uniref:trehalase-like n=1 Tax=Gigantopelta aegis TaxID=1735272 RepID=UPI001B88AFF6|nr:trehalase-like [Gigantopelta aegis]